MTVAVLVGLAFFAPAGEARSCGDGDQQTVLPPASARCDGDPVLMTPHS
jgi:hypothetical protein